MPVLNSARGSRQSPYTMSSTTRRERNRTLSSYRLLSGEVPEAQGVRALAQDKTFKLATTVAATA